MMKKPILSVLWLLAISLLPTVMVWASDLAAIQACLANWGDHPFDTHQPKYRVLGSQVKVFGVGGEYQ